jgi:hypothetical protein
MEYVKQHNLLDLVEVLSASLFYDRPENPKEYLIGHLNTIQKLKNAGAENFTEESSLFKNEDIEILFTLFSKKMNTVSADQAKIGYFFLFYFMKIYL